MHWAFDKNQDAISADHIYMSHDQYGSVVAALCCEPAGLAALAAGRLKLTLPFIVSGSGWAPSLDCN